MTNRNTCPDCGTGINQPHKSDCDVERSQQLIAIAQRGGPRPPSNTGLGRALEMFTKEES